jgi:hypothetical protein
MPYKGGLILKNKDIKRYININIIKRLLLFIRIGKGFYITIVIYNFNIIVNKV